MTKKGNNFFDFKIYYIVVKWGKENLIDYLVIIDVQNEK